MILLVLSVIAFIWLAGAWMRIYRHARFYQIEEYMTGRYLRWLLRSREHWLPMRPIIAWAGGVVLSLAAYETLSAYTVVLATAGAAVLGAYPPPAGEQKKRFRATPRAKRMLGTAFVISVLPVGASTLFIALMNVPLYQILAVSFLGLLTLLAAPLWLILGNWLMTPVEVAIRERFIQQARRTLDEIRPTVIGITGSYGKT